MTIEYLRSFKISGYAIFDFVVTFVGVFLLAPVLTKIFAKIGLKISTKSWLLLSIPLSMPIHMLFGAYTPMVKNFLNPDGEYPIKVIVILLTYWGVKEIKRKK